MIPIRQVVPGALAAVLRDAPLTPEKVQFAWRTAVGPAVANVTAACLREGVLAVEARDRHWQREVQRNLPMILARLQELLGTSVTRVEVTAIDAAGPPKRRRSP